MRKISISITDTMNTIIETTSHEDWHVSDGVCIDFFFSKKDIPQKEHLHIVNHCTSLFTWMQVEGGKYFFNLEKLKEHFNTLFYSCKWMQGTVRIDPSTDYQIDTGEPIISFCISEGDIAMAVPKKIFLSHKGSNKPMVRKYFELLKELGYEPWLDEDAMVAGVNPDRAIIEGFKESCACVFFITPEFVDETFLADEIENARFEKRSKGEDRFKIITLQFTGGNGEKGKVPELLQRGIYKTPTDNLEAFKEIVRALPIRLGQPYWR